MLSELWSNSRTVELFRASNFMPNPCKRRSGRCALIARRMSSIWSGLRCVCKHSQRQPTDRVPSRKLSGLKFRITVQERLLVASPKEVTAPHAGADSFRYRSALNRVFPGPLSGLLRPALLLQERLDLKPLVQRHDSVTR